MVKRERGDSASHQLLKRDSLALGREPREVVDVLATVTLGTSEQAHSRFRFQLPPSLRVDLVPARHDTAHLWTDAFRQLSHREDHPSSLSLAPNVRLNKVAALGGDAMVRCRDVVGGLHWRGKNSPPLYPSKMRKTCHPHPLSSPCGCCAFVAWKNDAVTRPSA